MLLYTPFFFPSFPLVILTPSLHYAVFTHLLREKKSNCTLFLWLETEQTKGDLDFFFVLTKSFISVPRLSETAELAKVVN